MRQWSIGSIALGVFCIAIGAQGAAPEGNPGKADEVKAGKAERAGAKADKARERLDAKGERAERRAAAKAEKEAAEANRAEAKSEEAEARDGKEGIARGASQGKGGMRALHQEIARGKLDKASVKERLDALRASREERQKAHRRMVAERYRGVIEHASVREELRHHARRTAFLNRALLVAQTELDAKNGPRTVARIEKLILKENARHQRAMARLEAEGVEEKAQAPDPQKPRKTELNAPAKGTEP